MNKKFKYLFKNTGLLFISNFSSKILVFLLVPLYTAVLSTEEFGTYDLLYTTVELLLPILGLNITASIMRFSLGAEKERQKQVFSVGVKYVSISVLLLLALSVVAFRLPLTQKVAAYQVPFILMFASISAYQLTSQFTRGLDDVKGLAIAGVLGTVTTIGLNLLFLLRFRMGIMGYFYANIMSQTVSAGFMFVRNKMWRYINGPRNLLRPSRYEGQMLRYCIPLIITSLSWYINCAADRYAVTWFYGLEANGVYSVAYKIPAILNAFQVIFIQAWQLSAIKEFDSQDKDGFYSKTYQGCHMLMLILTSCLVLGSRILSRILFSKDFYEAWHYVPTLLLYVMFNTLSGTVGGIFTAVKDVGSLSVSAVASTLCNVALNMTLVPLLGPEGAAIATVASSVVLWGMRMLQSRRHIRLQVNFRKQLLECGILFLQVAALTLIESLWGYGLQILFLGLLCAMNWKGIWGMIPKKGRPAAPEKRSDLE